MRGGCVKSKATQHESEPNAPMKLAEHYSAVTKANRFDDELWRSR